MKFKEYWKDLTPEAKLELAEKSETSHSYLSQVANGHRNAGARLIEKLMDADHNITFKMMRE